MTTKLLTTADLSPPDGLTEGARKALLRLVIGGSLTHGALILAVFRAGAHGDLDDYLDRVARAHGFAVAERIKEAMRSMPGRYVDLDALDPTRAEREAMAVHGPIALLLTMPDADFLTAVAAGVGMTGDPMRATSLPSQINDVCRKRGVPFRMTGVGATAAFEWVGDAVIEHEALRPAMAALDDARLKSARADFDNAREQLREDTPAARRRAVAEACNAVEAALRVLLIEHGHTLPGKPVLTSLLSACRDAELFPVDEKAMSIQHVIGAAGRFGNERARHGDEDPLDVEPDEAGAVVAAAAVALTLVARRLP